jgi:superfamily II DNA or RNA helicase
VFDGVKKNYTYFEYNSTIEKEKLNSYLSEFKKKDNLYGENIKVILLSSIGAEGINLFNVKYLHIIEPHWNETKIYQVIGRAVRRCSHMLFDEKDRFVKIYRYLLDVGEEAKSTDKYIYNISTEKQKKIDYALDL